MKKLMLLCFFMVFTAVFSGEKRISGIKTLEFITKEKLTVNGGNRDTEYKVKFQIPNKIKKEMLLPEINKGELYIYTGEEKIVYLPLFEQVSHEKVSSDENRIIEVINYIFEKEKKDTNFRKKYYNGEIKEIVLEDGIKIVFNSFKNIAGYILPETFELYDNNIKIGNILIENYQINPKFDKKEFILEEWNFLIVKGLS